MIEEPYEVDYTLIKKYVWEDESKKDGWSWPYSGHKALEEKGRECFKTKEDAVSFAKRITEENVGSTASVYFYTVKKVPDSIRSSAKDISKILENMDYGYHDDRPIESQGCSTGQADRLEAIKKNIYVLFNLKEIGEVEEVARFYGEKDQTVITCKNCGEKHPASAWTSNDCSFHKNLVASIEKWKDKFQDNK